MAKTVLRARRKTLRCVGSPQSCFGLYTTDVKTSNLETVAFPSRLFDRLFGLFHTVSAPLTVYPLPLHIFPLEGACVSGVNACC